MHNELLRLGQQPALVEEAGANPLLRALDEDPILGADLVVEGQHLSDPGFVRVRRDKVVEEAIRALGAAGNDRAMDRFGRPGMTFTTVFGNRKWNWPRSTSPERS